VKCHALLLVFTLGAAAGCAERGVGPTGVPQAMAAGNLMLNGGFESSESHFAPWVFNIHADPHSFEFVSDNSVAKEGKASLRVRRLKDEPFASVVQYFDRSDLSADRYRLSAWIRGEGLTAPVYLYTGFFTASYQSGVDGGPEHGKTGTFDWTRIEREFSLSERTARIETGVTTTGDGTLWLDAVELVPLVD
jgi:hypothetical protein